ncbi:hypothetical protein FISHEDRAFT_40833 [Fistulina hepatica ATCC 64428]|uniref:C-CAP/cofactor C-like domain-containing protein n=1 Tax=Fistulina hepatica ATCC 64428 TaxID=1128425 RepID=A0A0D7AEM7_9AGAR|nr:hypothetical protein FISHEDRAFT_40833 [Fistulina hepatica ATCC 64428]
MESAAWISDFAAQFNKSKDELQSDIDASINAASPSSVDIHSFSLRLQALTKTLADATGSIPTYDQRQFEMHLKGLERQLESLRQKAAPKPRFAFKRKTAIAVSAPHSESSACGSQVVTRSLASSKEVPSPSTSAATIFHCSREYITRSSLRLRGGEATEDLIISNLDYCLVNLIQPAVHLSALHLQNVSHSVVLLPAVAGSVLVEEVQDCIISLGCHQFRMYNSSDVDIYLSLSTTASHPVIEHCSSIRFSRSQVSLCPPTRLIAGFSTVPQEQAAAVQDFSHIRSTPSPNWQFMSPDHDLDIQQVLSTPTGTAEEIQNTVQNILQSRSLAHSSNSGI